MDKKKAKYRDRWYEIQAAGNGGFLLKGLHKNIQEVDDVKPITSFKELVNLNYVLAGGQAGPSDEQPISYPVKFFNGYPKKEPPLTGGSPEIHPEPVDSGLSDTDQGGTGPIADRMDVMIADDGSKFPKSATAAGMLFDDVKKILKVVFPAMKQENAPSDPPAFTVEPAAGKKDDPINFKDIETKLGSKIPGLKWMPDDDGSQMAMLKLEDNSEFQFNIGQEGNVFTAIYYEDANKVPT